MQIMIDSMTIDTMVTGYGRLALVVALPETGMDTDWTWTIVSYWETHILEGCGCWVIPLVMFFKGALLFQ